MNKWIGFVNTKENTSGIMCPWCKTRISSIDAKLSFPAEGNTLGLSDLIYCPRCGEKNILGGKRNDL